VVSNASTTTTTFTRRVPETNTVVVVIIHSDCAPSVVLMLVTLPTFFHDEVVIMYLRYGSVLLLLLVGWLVSVGLCRANVPPGCSAQTGTPFNAALAMDATQYLLLFGVSACWFANLRHSPNLLLSAWFLIWYTVFIFVMAGLFTPTGLNPLTRAQCCSQSPAAIVCVCVLFFLAFYVIVTQVRAAFLTITMNKKPELITYCVSRLALLCFYIVCLSLVSSTDSQSTLTFSPFVFGYIGATFCAFTADSHTNIGINSKLCLAICLASMAQGLAMGPILFAPFSNCQVAPSFLGDPATCSSFYGSSTCQTSNVSNAVTAIRISTCLVSGSEGYTSFSTTDQVIICAQFPSAPVCTWWSPPTQKPPTTP
jgi:hypothetical protein